MKQLLLLSIIILNFSACAIADEKQHKAAINNDYRTGQITKTELKSHEKFFRHHDTEVSAGEVELLKSIDQPIIITTYFGLWCHDSKREVPQLLDLLEAADNKNIIHRLIALDLEKKEPFGRQEDDEVKFTPTIIVKVDDKEVGRIVERPRSSLAQDIVSFIKN